VVPALRLCLLTAALFALGPGKARAESWAVGGTWLEYPDNRLLLLRIGDAGEIDLVQSEPVTSEAVRVRADPLGRRVVAFQWPGLSVWEFTADHRLVLGDTITEEPVIGYYYHGLTLSPDGRMAITEASKPHEPEHDYHLRSFSISASGEISFLGRSASSEDWGYTSAAAISPVGSDTVVVSLDGAQQGVHGVALLRLLPDGSFIDQGVRLPFPPRSHVEEPAVSPDGRWALVGIYYGGTGIASIRLDGQGGGEIAAVADDPALAFVETGLAFHPSQRFAVLGAPYSDSCPYVMTAAFDSETGAIGPAIDQGLLGYVGGNRMAVSANCRFALVAYATLTERIFKTFRILDDGKLEPTGYQLTGLPDVRNLEFIPPRPLAGDANRDGRVDSADVVTLVNDLVGEEPILHWIARENADLDHDGDLDADDLEGLIGMLLAP
jgi:hypothetical protein